MPSDRLVLAFDTSAAHCAAALIRGPRLLAHRHEEMGRGQAERLMPLIQDMLDSAGVPLADIDAIGVGTGPGNFTGIRIAVAAARGLALALGRPARGVTAFEALLEGDDGPALAAVDARRGMVYLGTAAEPLPHPLCPDDLPARFRDSGLPVVGHDAASLAALTGGPVRDAAFPVAEAIARHTLQRLESGDGRDWPRPAPLYLRPADAAPPANPAPAILP